MYKIARILTYISHTEVMECFLDVSWTIEDVCFERIEIGRTTGPKNDNDHIHWDNLCMYLDSIWDTLFFYTIASPVGALCVAFYKSRNACGVKCGRIFSKECIHSRLHLSISLFLTSLVWKHSPPKWCLSMGIAQKLLVARSREYGGCEKIVHRKCASKSCAMCVGYGRTLSCKRTTFFSCPWNLWALLRPSASYRSHNMPH